MIFQRNHYARLSIKYVSEYEIGQLEELLRGASNLKHLQVGDSHKGGLSIVKSVTSTRGKIVQDKGSMPPDIRVDGTGSSSL